MLGDDTDGAAPEVVQVSRKIPHENYDPRSFENDIALLELERDVRFRDGIYPACLPSANQQLLDNRVLGL